MCILDGGGTMGTLLNVIGLCWDLVRVSAEDPRQNGLEALCDCHRRRQ